MNKTHITFKRTFAAFTLTALIIMGATSPLTISAAANNVRRSYIVTFNESVDANKSGSIADSLGNAHGFGVKHKYKKAVKGFSASMPAARAEALKNDPRVASVMEDKTLSLDAQTNPLGVKRVKALPSQNINRGTGSVVAVLDTGIDLEHPDLAKNIIAGTNCIDPTQNADDTTGHGSHVAGTIAAIKNTTGVVGVVDQAKLVAVKVLTGGSVGMEAFVSDVICGLDWVVENAPTYNIKVVNMSLSGPGTSDNNCGNTDGDILHQAVCRVAAAGITQVVSAGNTSSNANTRIPAAYDDAVITVSALNDTDGLPGKSGASNTYGRDDSYPSFSNYGSVVDIAAPGTNVYSANYNGGYTTKSGTSQAAPHVAGAAAMYIKNNPTANWQQVRAGLLAVAETSGTKHTITTTHPEPVVWTIGL